MRCLRANGRKIFASTMETSSLSASILKKCSPASSAMRRARRKSSMRVPVPLASVRFIAISALNGLASSSAREPFAARACCARHWRSTASISPRCFSSMKPALNRSSPRYATVISRDLRTAGGAVTVMAGRTSILLSDFQQKPFEVLPLGAVQRHRMILARGEAPDDGDAPPGIVRGGEDDLLEEVERHVAGAGEGHHPAAVLDELQREEVDVLVAAGGTLDFAARFGEGRRVADDEAEALPRLPDEGENVGDGEVDRGFEHVQIVIAARRFDGGSGDGHIVNVGRARRRGIDAERATKRKEVEHAPAVRVRAGEGAVVALVEEKAGLLPGRNVDVEAQAVLEDRRLRLAVPDRFRLHRQPLERIGKDNALTQT